MRWVVGVPMIELDEMMPGNRPTEYIGESVDGRQQ